MKRVLMALSLVFLVVAYGAAENAGLGDAMILGRQHAEMDTSDHESTGWGWGAFGASVLLSPLFGGGGVIVAAYMSGEERIPIHRLAWAQEEFSDNSTALYTYQNEYEDVAKEMRRDANVKSAWIGTGVGFGINLVFVIALYSVVLSGY